MLLNNYTYINVQNDSFKMYKGWKIKIFIAYCTWMRFIYIDLLMNKTTLYMKR